MQTSPKAERPEVLSYLALRKAVGIVAVSLPFVLAIPWLIVRGMLEPSISDYYYTAMRNLFVGSLCAIAMFQLACRGFDRRDEIAGIFSAVCALGVAFFPTARSLPVLGAPVHPKLIGYIHYTFAALLFLALAYFCLALFKMTAADKIVTRQKMQRNRVYTVSGYAILASIGAIAFIKILEIAHVISDAPSLGPFGTTFIFETTSLVAFGIAWLIKGETFLKDEVTPERAKRAAAGELL